MKRNGILLIKINGLIFLMHTILIKNSSLMEI